MSGEVERSIREMIDEIVVELLDRRLKQQHADTLLTPAAAAEQISVSQSWFRNRWEDFNTVKLSNGCYRIPQSSIDRYIQSRQM